MDFLGNISRKRGNGNLLEIEMEKCQKAARIGSKSGLFRVPAVVEFDRDAGVLDFEYIPNLVTLSEMVVRRSPKCDELATRAGRAIATVHQRLELDEELRTPLPPNWRIPNEESVFFHGDLSANNICVDTVTHELVLVDWSTGPMVGRQPTVGPREFDLISFVWHLIVAAPWKATLTWPGTHLSDRFISGYIETPGSTFSQSNWERYSVNMSDYAWQVLQQRVRSSSPLKWPIKALCQLNLYRRWKSYKPRLVP